MHRARHHVEQHRLQNLGWLRAAVLGANDGIVSTASLILGVAGASATSTTIAIAGVAALVAGAMSMATGEYVSVSSQADSERAALDVERAELAEDYVSEERELTGIYIRRGLDVATAKSVATQLMQHDALGAHARDELGLTGAIAARPLQAASASASSFAVGAALPLAVVFVVDGTTLPVVVGAVALIALGILGGLAAWVGGAPVGRGIARVTFWSSIAMAATWAVGRAFGTSG